MDHKFLFYFCNLACIWVSVKMQNGSLKSSHMLHILELLVCELVSGLVLTELMLRVNQMMILTVLITSRNHQKIAAIR